MAAEFKDMTRAEVLSDYAAHAGRRVRYIWTLLVAGVVPVLFWATALSMVDAAAGTPFFYPLTVVVIAWGLLVLPAAVSQTKTVLELLWFVFSGTKAQRRALQEEELTPRQEAMIRRMVSVMYNTSPFALLGTLAAGMLYRLHAIERVEEKAERSSTSPEQYRMENLGEPPRRGGIRVRVAMQYLEDEQPAGPRELVTQSH